jgi:hypothetical protein
VLEPDVQTEFDQLGRLGRFPGIAPDAKALGSAPQQTRVAQRLGRRRQEQTLRVARQCPNPLEERLLDAVRQRPRVRETEAARQLGR